MSDVDVDARRRVMQGRLKIEADAIRIPERERDEVLALLPLLGRDELRVVERAVDLMRCRLAHCNDNWRPLSWRLAARLIGRLVAGKEEYGALNLATDKRKFAVEVQEEALDIVAYAMMSELSGQRSYSAILLSSLMEIGGEP